MGRWGWEGQELREQRQSNGGQFRTRLSGCVVLLAVMTAVDARHEYCSVELSACAVARRVTSCLGSPVRLLCTGALCGRGDERLAVAE